MGAGGKLGAHAREAVAVDSSGCCQLAPGVTLVCVFACVRACVRVCVHVCACMCVHVCVHSCLLLVSVYSCVHVCVGRVWPCRKLAEEAEALREEQASLHIRLQAQIQARAQMQEQLEALHKTNEAAERMQQEALLAAEQTKKKQFTLTCAGKECEVVTVSGSDFHRLMEKSRAFNRSMQAIAARRRQHNASRGG